MGEVKPYLIRAFTGGMNTVVTSDDIAPGYDERPAEATVLTNWFMGNRGSLKTEPGYENYLLMPIAGRVNGIYRYTTTSGTTMLLVGVNGSLYKVDSTPSATLVSSGLANDYWHFETAYGSAIICDGTNVPWTYDGTTLAALGGSPPAGARVSLFYLDRLHVFSKTTQRSLVYYSDASNIAAGYAANFVPCNVSDGQDITAMGRYFIPGQLEPVIVVGKTRSVGVITGNATASNPYTYATINNDSGIVSFRGIVQGGQDMFYLTQKGVTSLKTDNQFTALLQNYVSAKVENNFISLNQDQLTNALSWYDFRNYRIRFAVAEAGYTYNNVIWNYDLSLGCWYKTYYNHPVTSAFVDANGDVYQGYDGGASAPRMFKVNLNSAAFYGNSIQGTYTTGYLDFGMPAVNKRIVDMRILATSGGQPLTVTTNYNYGEYSGSNISLTVSGPTYIWGGGVWTSAPSVYRWGGNSVSLTRHSPYNYFKSIQIGFIGVTNQSVPIEIQQIQFLVEYEDFR